jgi:glycosyltransferase involved in cell wall biosynthesis
MLFVTSGLSSGIVRPELKATWELIEQLAQHLSDCELVVVSLERAPRREDVKRLRSLGVRVLDGNVDWQTLFTEAAADISHAVVTTEAATQSSVLAWIDSKAPHAHRILYSPHLLLRGVAGEEPLTSDDERPGFLRYRRAVEEVTEGLVVWADQVWCLWASDAQFCSASFPGHAVHHIPAAFASATECGGDRLPAIALVAAEGADVISGHEDAALRGLKEILPQVRWAVPDLDCVVVTDNPTPMLIDAIREAKARAVPAKEVANVLDASRILLVAHGYGTGQASIVQEAISRGTAIVTTPIGRGEAVLGRLEGLAVRESDTDIAALLRRLLTDQALWDQHVEAGRELVSSEYDLCVRFKALEKALATAGVATRRVGPPFPPDGPRAEPPAVRKPTRPELRPPGSELPGDKDPKRPSDQDVRYRLWADRWGPTPSTLQALKDEISGFTYRPLISVLMPVHNTPPHLLEEAVASLADQIYEGWELCIANDGSSDHDTLQTLASLRQDRRITVVDLPEPRGISDATNAALSLASGDFVAFMDHDDLLKPHALAQVVRWLNADPELDLIYTDEDKLDEEGSLFGPHPKPDWSPDQLMVHNYINHLTVLRRQLVQQVGGLRPEMDGSQDHDLLLRLTEITDRIGHIPEPLYTWRALQGSAAATVDAKPYALEASRRAISEALVRRNYEGNVSDTSLPGCFRARYEIPGCPRVSIIIPTRDRIALLERCVDSILDLSTYTNYEIVIVDNNSQDGETLEYLAEFPGRVIRYPFQFNYARMMNLAACSVASDALLFLNNDTEVINPDWIGALLEHAMRPEVGAAGARLYYPGGKPQHEGIMVGCWGGWAGNVDFANFWDRGRLVRNASAVTGACTMIRPSVYWRVGGNDERLRVAYNDVDICLRIRQAGLEVVYTPFAELFHHEGASRSGYEHPEDGPLFGIRWKPPQSGDPYYNPLLSNRVPFAIKL